MPRKPPSTGRFVKGRSGNPKGSSAKAKLLRETATLTAQQVHEVAAVILHGNKDDLQALAKDPNASVLQMWTAALVAKSIQKGDSQVYRVLMERILGKPKESITVTGDAAAPLAFRDMSQEAKLARIEQLRRAREDLD